MTYVGVLCRRRMTLTGAMASAAFDVRRPTDRPTDCIVLSIIIPTLSKCVPTAFQIPAAHLLVFTSAAGIRTTSGRIIV